MNSLHRLQLLGAAFGVDLDLSECEPTKLGLDALKKEYDLIQEKQSKLSANERRRIESLAEKYLNG